MSKKKIVTIIAIIGVIFLGIKGKSLLKERQSEIKNAPTPTPPQVTIEAVKPKQGVLTNSISFLAQVESKRAVKLSTKLAGFVKYVAVKEAQSVKKGDLLVEIDAIELNSNIKALQATIDAQKKDVKLAKTIYIRNKKLYRVGALAKEKLEASKVALDMKKSILENSIQKLSQLRHQLTYLKIVAPFDGVVDAILLHKGDLAATGKPIIIMSDKKKKLLFSYTAKDDIKRGDEVYLKGKRIGFVSAIYPTSKNALFSAEVALDKDLLIPNGMNVAIDVLTKRVKGCIVSINSLIHKKNGTFVMVKNGDKFTPLKIKVVIKSKDRAIISPCPNGYIAKGSEVKLSQLGAYSKVGIIRNRDAK